MTHDAARALLLHCRAGFEKEAAAEISALTAAAGVHGYCRAAAGSTLVAFVAQEPEALGHWFAAADFRALIFARQWLAVFSEIEALPGDDRVTPIVEALARHRTRWGEAVIEYPDTNEGKRLSRFARRFAQPLERALARRGLIVRNGGARLHLVFTSSSAVRLGYSDPRNASPWPGGVPRLKLSREAPSRSALKLEEALLTLLDAGERDTMLVSGMRAVDLGAAPGGWSWVLARRGLQVTAVDKGLLAAPALTSGLVTHSRADGFVYRPPAPVDWLVCDIVDKPARVTELIARWLRDGHCRHALFNLKLPMQRRRQAVLYALERLRRRGARRGAAPVIVARQLYHDREEVTVYARAHRARHGEGARS